MPPDRQRRPGTAETVNQDADGFAGEDSASVVADATSGGPTWFLDARPLDACHGDHADEYAIECPEGCGREALAWRVRPGDKRSGWGCVCGARGRLWQLLPGVAS